MARALPGLPLVSAEMQRGRLSYAKVRAITRVARADNERALVDLALTGTAAQVERSVRAWRRADAVCDHATNQARHQARTLSTWVDDDGMVVIRGRLTPEVGAVVQRALEAAADRLFRDSAASGQGGGLAEETNHAQRRADALGLVAETALSADLDAGTAGDRYQVVVHVAAETPSDGLRESTIEVDDGALHVSAETSRRLTCDASVLRMEHDADGQIFHVGNRTRSIPPSIRRALARRDSGCQCPGCTSRRCDAHHIEHWADGGATSLDNLVLLCRRHHRAVHEGGLIPRRLDCGRIEFVAPSGIAIPAHPPSHVSAETLVPLPATDNDIPVWDGTPFDLVWAIDVLYRPPVVPEQEEEEGCGSCGNRTGVSKELVGALPA